MNYTASVWSVVIFALIVAAVMGISFYFSRKAKSASNYLAAGAGYTGR